MKTSEKPLLQDFHIEGIRHINPLDAFESLKSGEAVLIDVRENDETAFENIPLDHVLYHPMTLIVERLSKISKNQNIILVCHSGIRSVKVANLLKLQGYPDVANLDGGFFMWKSMGLPFETNISSGGCGCGCNPIDSPVSSCGDTIDKNAGSCCETNENKNCGSCSECII